MKRHMLIYKAIDMRKNKTYNFQFKTIISIKTTTKNTSLKQKNSLEEKFTAVLLYNTII